MWELFLLQNLLTVANDKAQHNVVSHETIHKFLDATPADCLKILDINLRQQFYTKDVIEESFKRCNILKINDEKLVVINRMYGYDGLDMPQFSTSWLYLVLPFTVKISIVFDISKYFE